MQMHDLSVLQYINGFTMWHYRSNNNLTDISQDNYFDGVADMLHNNDVVIIVAADGVMQRVVVAEGAGIKLKALL